MLDSSTIQHVNRAVEYSKQNGDNPDFLSLLFHDVRILYLIHQNVLGPDEITFDAVYAKSTMGNSTEEQLTQYEAFHQEMTDRFKALIELDIHRFYDWWDWYK